MPTFGIISDTHGRLPARVFDVFARVDLILHAGDIGDPDLLADLAALAPVTAVYGNMDGAEWRARVEAEAVVREAGATIVLLHGHLLADQRASTFRDAYPDADVVVHGHTHEARIERHAVPWVLNPGSAGAPRRGEPPSVAILRVEDGSLDARIVPL
ncbi:MAG: metallophosphoesterase family protein [Gemmatimonadota bacterium]